jgi:hypothetical protein
LEYTYKTKPDSEEIQKEAKIIDQTILPKERGNSASARKIIENVIGKIEGINKFFKISNFFR